ncbi:MAG: MATE family efflux transporter, partial [Bacteroidia bacterium]|nr:MATE family efflux transporter [Bacteroidia bacterium]
MSAILATIKEALRGEDADYTKMKVNRAIVLLAIPMILEMAMESLFAVVDAFFVGKVGGGALATIGFTESVLTVVYSMAFGLAMGTTAIVSRRWGEKDYTGAAKSSGTAIMIGLVLSLVLGIGGYFLAPDILRLMGAEQVVIDTGTTYTQIMFSTQIVIMLLFLHNGIFRGAGNATAAMSALWIANGLNIFLDPLFIYGWGPVPAMGVTGAAVATSIGRGVGVLFQIYLLYFAGKTFRLKLSDLGFDWSLVKRIIKVASGGAGQFLIASASWIFLMRIMSEFGTAVVDGYTASIRVIIFAILPAWGLSNAAATLVGQNLGAKQPERAEESVWITARYAMFFLLGVAVLMFILAPQILSAFSENEETIRVGALCLRVVAAGYPFFAYGMVLSNAFNGAGDTRTPTLLNLVCFWAIQIPLAYLLATQVGWEENGVYIAVVISET